MIKIYNYDYDFEDALHSFLNSDDMLDVIQDLIDRYDLGQQVDDCLCEVINEYKEDYLLNCTYGCILSIRNREQPYLLDVVGLDILIQESEPAYQVEKLIEYFTLNEHELIQFLNEYYFKHKKLTFAGELTNDSKLQTFVNDMLNTEKE